jgi:hypothetical protein
MRGKTPGFPRMGTGAAVVAMPDQAWKKSAEPLCLALETA